MENVKTIKDYEKELKTEKKRYDKLLKALKKCTSSYQYENLYDEIEVLAEDINQLQMIITELRQKKKKEQEELLEIWND